MHVTPSVPCIQRRVGDFLPLTDAVRDLLQFVLATRPLAFLARVSRSLDQQLLSYKNDLGVGFILAIGAAKEAGDKFAEAEQRGWFEPLLSQVPRDKHPLIHELHSSLRTYCDKESSGSLLARIKPIRHKISFHIDRTQLETAHQQLSSTVQEFYLSSPPEGISDPFLGLLSAQIVETATGKTSSELRFLVDEVPHFVAALANFGEQIYTLLLLQRVALETKAQPET